MNTIKKGEKANHAAKKTSIQQLPEKMPQPNTDPRRHIIRARKRRVTQRSTLRRKCAGSNPSREGCSHSPASRRPEVPNNGKKKGGLARAYAESRRGGRRSRTSSDYREEKKTKEQRFDAQQKGTTRQGEKEGGGMDVLTEKTISGSSQ